MHLSTRILFEELSLRSSQVFFLFFITVMPEELSVFLNKYPCVSLAISQIVHVKVAHKSIVLGVPLSLKFVQFPFALLPNSFMVPLPEQMKTEIVQVACIEVEEGLGYLK